MIASSMQTIRLLIRVKILFILFLALLAKGFPLPHIANLDLKDFELLIRKVGFIVDLHWKFMIAY